MKIITLNANGIRSAERKGFFPWMLQRQPDIVCIQETKAQELQLTAPVFRPEGYYCYYLDAEKKGYSGVALYCKQEPDRVIRGIGSDAFDREGRYIEACFGQLSVASLYLPSGSSGALRQDFKFQILDELLPFLQQRFADGQNLIVCGDWNIAHKKIDLKNWRGNQKNSGFLPEERAWMDNLFDEHGWIDAFRQINQNEEQYTWWSNRGQAWAKNVGWRIDYQILSPGFPAEILSEQVYKESRFSDHAPLIMNYRLAAELAIPH